MQQRSQHELQLAEQQRVAQGIEEELQEANAALASAQAALGELLWDEGLY